MANFEKIVKVTDAVLDCIPIVSSITNAAHVMYRVAHKVDALNPVAPGLKTSIKIHSLSKDNFNCFLSFIPVLGNLYKLWELVLRTIHCFDYMPCGNLSPTHDDDLITAVVRNNQEIVHLCLGNRALNDPDRAHRVLESAAYHSSNEVFRKVFNHRADWSAESLITALESCSWAVNDITAQNAADILDFWTTHGKVLDAEKIDAAIRSLKHFLKGSRLDLAERVIGILPNQTSFDRVKNILLNYSCTQYNYRGEVQKAGVLTEEHRNMLIAKITKPSLQQLIEYYDGVGQQLSKGKPAHNYGATHFDTLNQLLDQAQLQPDKIDEFIVQTISYVEFGFTESLVAKYEGQLTPQSKMKILKKLLASDSAELASPKKRAQLFALWSDKWRNDISAQAHELNNDIGEFITRTIHYVEFDFIEFLIAKYEELLTPQLKMKILKRLLSFGLDELAIVKQRVQLFASWSEKWRNDISAQAQELNNEIGEFIVRLILIRFEGFAFIESLVARYEGQLTPQSKIKILKQLLPSNFDEITSLEKRVQLFASWTERWKDGVSKQAYELYTKISHSGDNHADAAEPLSQMSSGYAEKYPSKEKLQEVNDRFKQILLEAFPDCDQAPQEAV